MTSPACAITWSDALKLAEWVNRHVLHSSTATERALEADGEKLRQFTGEDHGPEFLVTCEACDGYGEITVNDPPVSRWSIDPPGVHEVTCDACGGNGFLVVEAI